MYWLIGEYHQILYIGTNWWGIEILKWHEEVSFDIEYWLHESHQVVCGRFVCISSQFNSHTGGIMMWGTGETQYGSMQKNLNTRSSIEA